MAPYGLWRGNPRMNITIVGLGGVGGIVGSRLAAMKAPDHRVIFWCRGDTLKNIREKGLILEGPDGTLTVRPALATCDPKEAGITDVLIFATKGHSPSMLRLLYIIPATLPMSPS